MNDGKMQKLINTSIALANEKDGEKLLELILTDAMNIVECDAATLYINNGKALVFKIMINKTLNVLQGGQNGEITLPPVPLVETNICAYSVIKNELINIKDAYKSNLFDFSGPRNYDAMTGYKTTSMLVVPMENNKGEIVGALQLINAKDKDGNIVEFPKDCEVFARAFASQAAISLTNMNYANEIRDIMQAVVETFSTIIYTRTPYNVNHTANMVQYAEEFLKWLDTHSDKYKFSDDRKRVFLMAIWLHDVGKIVIPLEIMNKATRLGQKYDIIMERLEKISLIMQIDAIKNNGDISAIDEKIEKVRNYIDSINEQSYLTQEKEEKVNYLKDLVYVDLKGATKKWFTDDEIECMLIKAGTLTENERLKMQEHASRTGEILNQMKFTGEYAKIPFWASSHHEFLDGDGYPNKLSEKELDVESRILTIIDIFDGISAKDRPYKKDTPIEKVIAILREMAGEGKLDTEILELYIESKVWERVEIKKYTPENNVGA